MIKRILKGKIVKNFLILFSKEILLNILAIFTVGYMARKLGAINYGKFTYAISFASLLSILSNMGVRQYATREIVRYKDKQQEIYGLVVYVRLLLSVTMVCIGLLIGYFSSPDTGVVVLLLITLTMRLFTALYTNDFIIFESHEAMHFNALAQTVSRITVIVFVIGFLFFGFGLYTVAIIYLIGELLQYLITQYLIRKNFFKPVLVVDNIAAWDLIKKSFPFALLSVFYMIYFEIDKIMLFHIKSAAAVGIYQPAASLTYKLLIVSDAIGTAIFPRIVKEAKENKSKYVKLSTMVILAMFFIGIISSFGVYLFSSDIINIIYHSKEYIPSIKILQTIIWVLPLMFISKIFGFLMIANDNQKTLAWLYFGIVVVNLTTNFLLIPISGPIGAAKATLIAEAFGILMFIILHKKMGLFVRER